jgi:peptidoglycan/LPS O-acetylase OafA/YrhL
VLREINPGWEASSFIFGFPRVIAEFFAGALIYEVRSHLKPVSISTAVLVGAGSALCFSSGGFALLNSFTLVPLTVIFASTVKVEGTARSMCKLLGRLSYPVYIIHFPMYRLLWQISNVRMLSPILQTIVMGSTCVFVAMVLMVGDEKLRHLLTSKLLRTDTARPPETGFQAS